MITSPVRILCIGNELARGDGIGIRVGRVLRELPLPKRVRVDLRRCEGMELIDDLCAAEDLVVVDAAMTGDEPGQPCGLCNDQLRRSSV